jgi:hypothetical protein
MRVKHVGSNRYSRYREISCVPGRPALTSGALAVGALTAGAAPEVFRNNPQSLERIVPWLERELRAITNDSDVGIVRDFVLALMKTCALGRAGPRWAAPPRCRRPVPPPQDRPAGGRGRGPAPAVPV